MRFLPAPPRISATHARPPMQRKRLRLSGFSLLELIVVIGIVTTVAVLSVPQLMRIASASQLTAGANLLIDSLNLARQTAQTRNRPVEVRIYKAQIPAQPGTRYFRAVQVLHLPDYSKSLTAESTPVSMVQYLPGNVVVTETPEFSTFLAETTGTYRGSAPVPAVDRTGASVDYIAFRFLPSGATDLSPAGPTSAQSQWTLTLRNHQDPETATTPGKSYVTVLIDPVIGTVRSYRP
ncbi:hypothetical protein DB346_03285 [Verrucomicrobia bacterium LW23]|nr:hypothetical protein DB346_03285 [Verrucomicrobia bacterium LW23]